MLIAIPTTGRQTFVRTVQSVADVFESHSTIIVADESRSSSVGKKIATALDEIRRINGIKCIHLTDTVRQEFIKALANRSGVNREIIRFGLIGPRNLGATFGAAQNLLHLVTKDEIPWFFDDDIDVRPRQRSEGATTACWSLESTEPEEIISYRNADEAIASLPCASDCFSASNCPPSDANADRICAVTVVGLVGDPGWSSSAFLMLPNNQSTRKNTRRTNYHYALARRSRTVVKLSPIPSIRPMRNFQTAAYRLNNHLAGVPFFPILRGSDTLYGRSMGYAFPSYDIAYLPIAVGHWPEEERDYAGDFDFNLWTFLVNYIDCNPQFSGSGLNGLISLFETIAAMPIAKFNNFLIEAASSHRVRVREALIDSLYGSDVLPRKLTNDILSTINKLYINDNYTQLIYDLSHIDTEAIRKLISDWVALITIWPRLEGAALEVNQTFYNQP
jgi:hypothetical protein